MRLESLCLRLRKLKLRTNRKMMYRVQLWVGAELDIYNASKILLGLRELGRRRLIALRFTWGSCPWSHGSDSVVKLEVRDCNTNRLRRIAIDLWDRSICSDETTLHDCDIYFKRSFDRHALQGISEQQRGKIVAFGLNHPCSDIAALRLVPPYCLRFMFRRLSARLGLGAKNTPVSELVRILRNYVSLPDWREYEHAPSFPKERRILFQTRVWEPEDVSHDDPLPINMMRVNLVRALRSEFGQRFVGGLVPTSFALKNYPDLVANTNYRRRQYAAMSRGAFIGVYSRGLHYSNAFKLSEYLAASQCIVAEPLYHELPVPLVEGKHYAAFQNVDECVARCSELLGNEDKARQMRDSNHQYYRLNVRPVSHMRQVLDRAFGRWNGDAA